MKPPLLLTLVAFLFALSRIVTPINASSTLRTAGHGKLAARNNALPLEYIYTDENSNSTDFVAVLSSATCPDLATQVFVLDNLDKGSVVMPSTTVQTSGETVGFGLFRPEGFSGTPVTCSSVNYNLADTVYVNVVEPLSSSNFPGIGGGAGYALLVGNFIDVESKEHITELLGEDKYAAAFGTHIAYQAPVCTDSPFKGVTSITMETWFNINPKTAWGTPQKSCCYTFMSTFTTDQDPWEKLWLGLADSGILDFQTPSTLTGDCAIARSEFSEGNFLMPFHEWRHIAGVYDSVLQIKSVYINGDLIKQWNCTGSLGEMELPRFNLGRGREDYVDAKLDELRVWSIARTQAEIRHSMYRKLYPHEIADTLFYYDMDSKRDDGVLEDRSLFAHDIQMGSIDDVATAEPPVARRYGKFLESGAPIVGGVQLVQVWSNVGSSVASKRRFEIKTETGDTVVYNMVVVNVPLVTEVALKIVGGSGNTLVVGDAISSDSVLEVVPAADFYGTVDATVRTGTAGTHEFVIRFEVKENTTPVAGGAGQAVKFDGVDDFAYAPGITLDIKSGLNGQTGTEPYTIEFWLFHAAGGQKRGALYSFGNDEVEDNWCGAHTPGVGKGHYCVGRNDAWFDRSLTLQADWKPPNDGVITANIIDSWTAWNHWAISVPGVDNTGDNSVGINLYKNGKLFAQGINSWAPRAHHGFFLGTFPNYIIRDFHFTGYVDNVRIWSGVRSQAQIKETMYTSVLNASDKASLKGSWDFDEAHSEFKNLDVVTGSNQDALTFDFAADRVEEGSTAALTTMKDESDNGNDLELAGCVPPRAPFCVEGYNCGDHTVLMSVPCYIGELGEGVDHLDDARPKLVRSTAPIGGYATDVWLKMDESATIRLRGADPDSTQGSGLGTTAHFSDPIEQILVAVLESVPTRGKITTQSDPATLLEVGDSVALTERIIYTPNLQLGGKNIDSFWYKVSDGLLTSANTAQVNLSCECAPGFRLDDVTGTCVACAAGYISSAYSFNTDCEACKPGTFQELVGQTSCTSCEFGYFQNTAGQSVCKACLDHSSPTGFCPSSGHVPSPFDVAVIGLAFILGGVSLVAVVVVWTKRKSRIMLGFTWPLLSCNLMGVVLLATATVFHATPHSSIGVCDLRVIFSTIGIHLVFTFFITKNVRIDKLFNNPSLKKVKFTVWKSILIGILVMLVDLVIIGVWFSTSPFTIKSEFEHICESVETSTFVSILIVTKIPLFFWAFKTSRNVKAVPAAFNESTQLDIMSWSTALTLLLVGVLQVVVEDSTGTLLIAIGSLALTMVAFYLFSLRFVVKVFLKREELRLSSIRNSVGSNIVNSGGTLPSGSQIGSNGGRNNIELTKLQISIKDLVSLVASKESRLKEAQARLSELQGKLFVAEQMADAGISKNISSVTPSPSIVGF